MSRRVVFGLRSTAVSVELPSAGRSDSARSNSRRCKCRYRYRCKYNSRWGRWYSLQSLDHTPFGKRIVPAVAPKPRITHDQCGRSCGGAARVFSPRDDSRGTMQSHGLYGRSGRLADLDLPLPHPRRASLYDRGGWGRQDDYWQSMRKVKNFCEKSFGSGGRGSGIGGQVLSLKGGPFVRSVPVRLRSCFTTGVVYCLSGAGILACRSWGGHSCLPFGRSRKSPVIDLPLRVNGRLKARPTQDMMAVKLAFTGMRCAADSPMPTHI